MKKDQMIGLLLMVFAAFMYYQASLLPPAMFGALGADLFPKLLFIILMLLGAALFVQTTMRTRKEASASQNGPHHRDAPASRGTSKGLAYYRYVIFGFVLFCLYVVMMYYFGYVIATLVFLPLFMWVLGPKDIKALVLTAVVSLAMTFGMQYGFAQLLKIFLPSGAVF